MSYTRKFEELGRGDAAVAGGKGASLGELTRAGIPVPPGFVIVVDAFEFFLSESGLRAEIDVILHGEYSDDVERISSQISSLILNAPIPEKLIEEIKKGFDALGAEFVAVRSSATAEDGATAAWAGQLDSFLNTNAASLIENVRRCWASLYTSRAIVYAREKELNGAEISVAVVVQKMVASEVSGIAFSVHPVTENYNQIIIEAGLGLGEAIVSGQITPDSYIVEKSPRAITEVTVAEQKRALYRAAAGGNEWCDVEGFAQKLSAAEILELAEIVMHIESHYGFPCDIEWARAGGKFFIVQSRPITTLSAKVVTDGKDHFYKGYVRDFTVLLQQAWCDANSETVPYLLGTAIRTCAPAYIIYMHDGLGDMWENEQAYAWMHERIAEKIIVDQIFFNGIFGEYQTMLGDIAMLRKNGIHSADELRVFLLELRNIIAHFLIIYAGILDEGIPVEIVKKSQQMRDEDSMLYDCDKIIRAALYELYPEAGENVLYILTEELDTKIRIDELSERNEGFGVIPGIFAGVVDFKNFVEQHSEYIFDLDEIKSSDQVIGQTAYRGKISGRVKILKRKNQIPEVEEGDIIVSHMTTPDFMPAMRKAAAFVTEEGGITCHAAIFAREMKKPCVIGTRVATEVFKDGDWVEVDADTGTVRKMLSPLTLAAHKLQNYQRLFQWTGGGLPFLISDMFMSHYKTLHGLAVAADGVWTCYLPRTVVEKTLEDGVERLGDVEKFLQYRNDFETFKKACDSFFSDVIQNKNISRDELSQAFEYFTQLYFYYSKTEFFYIDKAYEQSAENEIIKNHLAEFDVIKNGGRTYLNKLFLGDESYLEEVLRILERQFSIPPHDLRHYSMNDLSRLYVKEVLHETILRDRKSAYVMIGAGTDLIIFHGEPAAVSVRNFLHNDGESSTSEIKGVVASKGKVQGQVKVLDYGYENFNKINELVATMSQGDILVADTTAPEIMVACKKAAAILTNQGGLMSHAAIISREMGIPCIVGLNNITDLVKDGDFVEVDADTGVVHILRGGG